jgi:hypothetical protein
VGRIRTIKPELFLDEDLGALSGDHLALFVGLLTLADREGRMEWRPGRVKATLFPYRPVDVVALAADLDEIGKVQLYETAGVALLWVPGFVRHQRPHPKEPASVLPEAPSREKKRPAVKRSETIPSSPVGREGKGREGDLGKDLPPRQKLAGSASAAPLDPREGGDATYKALVATLFVLFREDRGFDLEPDGKSWKALARLREKHDGSEIIRRWGHGVRAKYKARCSNFVDLESKWNDVGAPEAVSGHQARRPEHLNVGGGADKVADETDMWAGVRADLAQERGE